MLNCNNYIIVTFLCLSIKFALKKTKQVCLLKLHVEYTRGELGRYLAQLNDVSGVKLRTLECARS